MSNLDRLCQAFPRFVKSRLPVSILPASTKIEASTSPPSSPLPDPVEAMAVLLRGVALGMRYYRGATSRPAFVLPRVRMSEAQFIAFVDQLKSVA